MGGKYYITLPIYSRKCNFFYVPRSHSKIKSQLQVGNQLKPGLFKLI